MSLSEFMYTVIFRPKLIRWIVNRLILVSLPASVRIGGAKILINPNDPVISGALALGVYEPEETDYFSNIIRPGMTIVDVGANIGAYSAITIDRLCGKGCLVAVEPASENFLWLKRNLELSSHELSQINIHAIQAALSNAPGSARLYKNGSNKGDNRLYRDNLLAENEEVQVLTLDGLCQQKGILSIDILKIDVQGFEGKVIEGSRKILNSSTRCHLFFEFWPEGMQKAGSNPTEVIAMLKEIGFTLFELRHGKLISCEMSAVLQKNVGRQYVNLYGFRYD